MGYSQSSLAVRGKYSEEVLAALLMRRTGSREYIPESHTVAATLPSGWFLVIANRAGHEIIGEDVPQRLSLDSEVIACSVEEHVMVSEVAGWRDGRCLWRVTHDAQTSFDDLAIEGDLPAAFASIRDRLLAKQESAGGEDAGVDYRFSIPVELAMSFTGYSYNQDVPGMDNEAFEVLESVAPKKSLFRRLFGR